jgi:hypothetical protein
MEDILSFNNEEINKIQELLEKLMFAEKSEKKFLRGRLRDMKFYISDFTT